MPAASALTEPFLRIPSIVRAMLTTSGVDISARAMLCSVEPDRVGTMNTLNTLSTFATTPKKRKRESTILVPPDMMPTWTLRVLRGLSLSFFSNVLQVHDPLGYARMVTVLRPIIPLRSIMLSQDLKLLQDFNQGLRSNNKSGFSVSLQGEASNQSYNTVSAENN